MPQSKLKDALDRAIGDEPCICGRHRKDLRDAWNSLHKASELVESLARQLERGRTTDIRGDILRIQQDMSDARRLIDRVEQGR